MNLKRKCEYCGKQVFWRIHIFDTDKGWRKVCWSCYSSVEKYLERINHIKAWEEQNANSKIHGRTRGKGRKVKESYRHPPAIAS